MARRVYADGGTSKAERAARRIVGILREHSWGGFTSHDVLRLERAGLATADIKPALALLEEGDAIRPVDASRNPQGGRRQRLFMVNPALHGCAK